MLTSLLRTTLLVLMCVFYCYTLCATSSLASPSTQTQRAYHTSSLPLDDGNLTEYCPTLPNYLTPEPLSPAPTGWKYLNEPVNHQYTKNISWYIIDVLYGLADGPAYLQERILCKYAACNNYGCPTLILLTLDNHYYLPNITTTTTTTTTAVAAAADETDMEQVDPSSHWYKYSRLNNTYICVPSNKDVTYCPFAQQPSEQDSQRLVDEELQHTQIN